MKLKKILTTNSIVVGLMILASGCAQKEGAPVSEATPPAPAPVKAAPPATPQPAAPQPVVTAEGLKIEDTKVGTGAVAEAGKKATVQYTGWLLDGTKFDSSKDRGQPFTFPLGGGRVIKGWDQGVVGMKVGGVRKLTIPSQLGYGERGAGGGVIPPNATLVFEIELLGVE